MSSVAGRSHTRGPTNETAGSPEIIIKIKGGQGGKGTDRQTDTHTEEGGMRGRGSVKAWFSPTQVLRKPLKRK